MSKIERVCEMCKHFHDSYTMDAVWCDREPPGRTSWPHDAENATCDQWTPREEGNDED